MMSGHNADQRWYWTGKQYRDRPHGAPSRRSVAKVNAACRAAPGAAARGRWSRRHSARRRRARSRSPAAASRSAPAASPAPPATQTAFRASPEFDGDTLALAAALVDEMQLGRRADPDLLAISLSATDYVGHAYGTEGEEMCLQLTELDREIGDFLERARQPRHRLCGDADRRPRRQGRSRARAAGAASPTPRGSIRRSTSPTWARR